MADLAFPIINLWILGSILALGLYEFGKISEKVAQSDKGLSAG